jgi:two-component system NarL family sensor kinase
MPVRCRTSSTPRPRPSTRSAAARGGFAVDLDDWPDDVQTPAGAVLYRTARELLGNVVAHAARWSMTVGLRCLAAT